MTKSEDETAVSEVRKLVIDCCRQNGGGHGGSAIGMAPLAVSLWRYVMRYSAKNPNWFDRDRFVMSNGHAAILQYVMLHLSGYEEMTMDQLKGYADPKLDGYTTVCHGHPEIEIEGVEITTGPLGQGIANAVGLAIASKNLQGTFNKPDIDIIRSTIFCTTGDACLQEGVGLEAVSLAGFLGLDNLVLIYDNNAVTCDGPLDWIFAEDINKKMEACGWNVIDVINGDTSIEPILKSLEQARGFRNSSKPTFINIRTTIGYGTTKQGTAGCHHSNFSDDDARRWTVAGAENTSHFVTQGTRDYFAAGTFRGAQAEQEWISKLEQYKFLYPENYIDLKDRMEGKINYKSALDSFSLPTKPAATREINGELLRQLFAKFPWMIGGGADLSGPTKISDNPKAVFDRNHASGRFLRYGIREHAMASISNGIAAYGKGIFIPFTATFFMFYLYAAPGVRMGALSELQVIHIATHDSFAEGQNGPTHQAVELDSLFRSTPNLQYIRPADGEELLGAWKLALDHTHGPTMLSLARDPMAPIENSCRVKMLSGGYVVSEKEGAVVTLVSSGSELSLSIEASIILNSKNIPTRIVSMPCIGVFDKQSESYKDSVLGTTEVISVEPYIPTIWPRYCTASIGMKGWGYSASGPSNYIRFGLDPKGIASRVETYLQHLPNKHRLAKWSFI